MMELLSFVAGQWVTPTQGISTLVNPATEEALATLGTGGWSAADALAYAKLGRANLQALSFAERAALLKDLSKLLHAHREALLDVAQANGGATRGDAKFDVDGAIGTLAAYAETGKKLAERAGERRFLTDGEAFALTRDPRFVGQHIWTSRPGVAVHINAFNFPAWGTFEKVAVAFLAGVPVITKPATATAHLTYAMVKLLVESGRLPEGSLQLVLGGLQDLLDRLGPQDHVAFTGSADTGARIRSTPALIRNSVRVNVEADSLNAAVLAGDVTPDSDTWRTLVRHAALEMTQKTGQKCTATRRIFVPEAHVDAFGEALVEALSVHTVGDPTTDGVTIGPVASAAQLTDVLAGISALAAEGRVLTGGAARIDGANAAPGKGYFVAPTVIVARSFDAPEAHRREVFGPVCTILPYDGTAATAAEGIGLGQGSLVSTVYSDDRAWLDAFVPAAAPWLGRLMIVSEKVAEKVTAPGMVLPSLVHGGPGRAGGGEELGGERGLLFYLQRTALQGDRVVIGKHFGSESV